jgi:hypothetical protein
MLIGSSANNSRDFGGEMGWGEGVECGGFVWLKKGVLGEGKNAFLKHWRGLGWVRCAFGGFVFGVIVGGERWGEKKLRWEA